jgi:hypothetical protein
MRRRTHMAVAGGGAAAIASLATGGVAHAANTFTVTNLNDSGTGSLRAAIQAVDADTTDTSAPGDSIVFATGLSGTIDLTGGQMILFRPAQIAGPGAGQLTVQNGSTRDLYTDAPLTLSGLTLSGHDATLDGGAIYAYRASLTLDNAVVSGSTARFGGGIFEYGAPVTINGSTISGNTATGATYSGAGGVADIYANISVNGSTIAGNTANRDGGGLYTYGGDISATDSTVTGNTAESGAGIFGGGSVQLTGDTVAANPISSGGYGTQVVARGSGKQMTLDNSIVSGSGSAPDVGLTGGATGSASFSLIRDPAPVSGDPAVSTDATDIVGKDPQLGALANNGGPTETMLPAATSPVLDQGKSFGLATDQRGLSRPFALPMITSVPAGGDRSDIGAVEVHETVVDGISPSTGTGGTQVTINGGDLSGASEVLFGSTPASSFRVLSDSQIVATAPAQSGGTVDVRVVAPGGESPTLAADQFTFATLFATVSKAHPKLVGKEVKTGIRVSCPAGGSSCKGSFKATAYLGHHKAKLGGGNISLIAGHSKMLTFKLSKKALKQLEKTGHLRITVTIVIADGNGKKITVNRTFTIKPAHHKKHHKH